MAKAQYFERMDIAIGQIVLYKSLKVFGPFQFFFNFIKYI